MECPNQIVVETSTDITNTTDACADESSAVNGTHTQSASSSDGVTHSTHSSLAHLSSRERLRRLHAAEELKQKERYAAFVEAQKQVEQARLRVQEDRKRKIEEVRQRGEIRRSQVNERRRELERSNKVRLDSLRERSRQRTPHEGAGSAPLKPPSGRTGSISPTSGSARNPNQLMTTSCVVAFGSSAPRSIFPCASARHTVQRSAARNVRDDAVSNRNGATTETATRSDSAETLDKRKEDSVLSVFERLASGTKHRIGSVSDTSSKPPSDQSKSHSATISASKRRQGLPGHGMSVSVYNERTRSRKPPTSSPVHRNVPANLPSPSSQVPEETRTDPALVAPVSDAPENSPVSDKTDFALVNAETSAESKEEPISNESESSPAQIVTPLAGPIQAETHGAGEGAVLNESEAVIYRAKLVEQRRLAKERKEEEQRRLEEENRKRRIKQEQERLAAEEAARELARAMAFREAEEADRVKRQREEEEKARFAAAEAERLLKIQQAEEERLLRKKKLDSIMSRVKSSAVKAPATVIHSTSTPAFIVPPNQKVNETRELSTLEPSLFAFNSSETPTSETLVNNTGDDVVRFTIDGTPVSDSTQPLSTDSASNETESVQTVERITAEHTNFMGDSDGVEVTIAPLFAAGGDTISADPSNIPEPFAETSSLIRNGSGDHTNVFASLKQETELTSPWDIQGVTQTSDVISSDSNFPQSDSENFSHHSLKQSNHPFTGVLPTVDHTPTTNGIDTSETPRFKSALLQSMLGAGRLETSTKDAVSDIQYS